MRAFKRIMAEVIVCICGIHHFYVFGDVSVSYIWGSDSFCRLVFFYLSLLLLLGIIITVAIIWYYFYY